MPITKRISKLHSITDPLWGESTCDRWIPSQRASNTDVFLCHDITILCLPQGLSSLIYLCSTDMYRLINYVAFVNWLSIGLSVVALLWFRWKRPGMQRPIKVSFMLQLGMSPWWWLLGLLSWCPLVAFIWTSILDPYLKVKTLLSMDAQSSNELLSDMHPLCSEK